MTNQRFIVPFPEDFKPTIRDHPSYGQWSQMKTRCTNPNIPKYRRWGGRGIQICKRWSVGENGYSGFECFMMDMGPRPSRKHSVDRIDNDGNYEPANCRWATHKQQANNRSSNCLITYKGETLSMLDTAEKYGISYFVLRNRVSRGWPHDEAIETPAGASLRIPKTAMGEQLPQTKLTASDVVQIRQVHAKGGLTMQEIGDMFGVSPANVCLIVNRKSWKHVK